MSTAASRQSVADSDGPGTSADRWLRGCPTMFGQTQGAESSRRPVVEKLGVSCAGCTGSVTALLGVPGVEAAASRGHQPTRAQLPEVVGDQVLRYACEVRCSSREQPEATAGPGSTT
jgi:hypothetical protein